jgi:hypothetical protein
MKKAPAITLWIIAVVIALYSFPARSGEREVEAAILFLLEKGIPEHKIKPFKGHPLARNQKKRLDLTRAIVEAAQRHDVPEMLLVAIAFRENSLNGRDVGADGEVSAFQIMPFNQRNIVNGLFPWTDYKEPHCELSTLDGAALCASALLRIHYLRCQDWSGAVVLYATGKSCSVEADTPERTKRRRFIRWDRIGIMEVLDENK